jgi:LEA14-like dessication related protein
MFRLKPRYYFSLIYLLLPFLLPSCAAPKPLEYRDFKNFSIEKVGVSQSTVKMDLVYFNPNNFGLQLKKTEIDIYINDIYMGHTSQDHQVNLERKALFTFPVAVAIDMKNILKNSWNLLTKKEVTVKVTGTIKVGKANTFISFPVWYQGTHSFQLL